MHFSLLADQSLTASAGQAARLLRGAESWVLNQTMPTPSPRWFHDHLIFYLDFIYRSSRYKWLNTPQSPHQGGNGRVY